MKVVTVTYDPRAGTLSADPVALDLGDQFEAVTWIFSGIPNNLLPRVDFVAEDGSNLGPFGSLRTTAFQVIGEGRSRSSGLFKYTVGLIDAAQGTVVQSSSLSLASAQPKRDPAPTVEVSPRPEGQLAIVPEELAIWRGDTVSWSFLGFEGDDWYPEIVFFEGPRELVSMGLGPFRSITRHATAVLASGNNGAVGTYRYRIRIIDLKTGRVTHGRDPALANNGDPPGG